jgi:hypothetical protein
MRHGLAHPRRGPCDRVAPEIDLGEKVEIVCSHFFLLIYYYKAVVWGLIWGIYGRYGHDGQLPVGENPIVVEFFQSLCLRGLTFLCDTLINESVLGAFLA